MAKMNFVQERQREDVTPLKLVCRQFYVHYHDMHLFVRYQRLDEHNLRALFLQLTVTFHIPFLSHLEVSLSAV